MAYYTQEKRSRQPLRNRVLEKQKQADVMAGLDGVTAKALAACSLPNESLEEDYSSAVALYLAGAADASDSEGEHAEETGTGPELGEAGLLAKADGERTVGSEEAMQLAEAAIEALKKSPAPKGISLVDAIAGHQTGVGSVSDDVAMPTLEGLNDFLNVLRRRPMPVELQPEEQLAMFKNAISACILSLYKDRIRPTLGQLQRKLREKGLPEPAVSVSLPVCAHDAPRLYQIQPPMRGEQPTVYLNKAPRWFQGFLDDEVDKGSAGAGEQSGNAKSAQIPAHPVHAQWSRPWDQWSSAQQDASTAAAQARAAYQTNYQQMPAKAVQHGSPAHAQGKSSVSQQASTKQADKKPQKGKAQILAVGPVQPGAYVKAAGTGKLLPPSASAQANPPKTPDRPPKSPGTIGPPPGLVAATGPAVSTPQSRKPEAPMDEESAKLAKVPEEQSIGDVNSSSVCAKVDVSDLMKELVMAFPHGMRFNQLKHMLKDVSGGDFGENSFACPTLPQPAVGSGVFDHQ